MILLPRRSWQLTTQPVVGPASVLRSVVRIAIHYTAAATIPDDVPAYLRAIQNDYTRNRGYSIGYNFAVDRLGRAWECRGLDIKCAANKGVNDTTIAILCLVDGDQPANVAMTTTIRELVTLIRVAAPGARVIVGHQDIGSTSCPGRGLQAQVRARLFEPTHIPDPHPIPAIHAGTSGDPHMKLRIIGNADDKDALDRWITNGLVRVRPTADSVAWLMRTRQIEDGQSLQDPDWVPGAVIAAIPLVNP